MKKIREIIEHLMFGYQLDNLWESYNDHDQRLLDVEREIQKKTFTKDTDLLPDGSMDAKIVGHLRAIEEYLKIRVETDFKDDPGEFPPMPRQIKYYKATKLK
jgi:hypothetical protein